VTGIVEENIFGLEISVARRHLRALISGDRVHIIGTSKRYS
jgi:hypothetical protein